jgi:hypothetical protein
MYGISQWVDEHTLFELDHGTYIDWTYWTSRYVFFLCVDMGLSENSVPLNPMVNDHYPY